MLKRGLFHPDDGEKAMVALGSIPAPKQMVDVGKPIVEPPKKEGPPVPDGGNGGDILKAIGEMKSSFESKISSLAGELKQVQTTLEAERKVAEQGKIKGQARELLNAAGIIDADIGEMVIETFDLTKDVKEQVRSYVEKKPNLFRGLKGESGRPSKGGTETKKEYGIPLTTSVREFLAKTGHVFDKIDEKDLEGKFYGLTPAIRDRVNKIKWEDMSDE